MTVAHEVWVRCDGTESTLCDEEIVIQGTASEATAAAVLEKAREAGWSCAGLHLCPIHRLQSTDQES